MRLGVDALTGALAGRCSAVRRKPVPRKVVPGERFCTLELDVGGLALHAPLPGTLERFNPLLSGQPQNVLDDPYGAGWLVDLTPDASVEARTHAADEFARQAELDLRRFRRGAALRMMTTVELGPVLADGGRPLCDLRELLGPSAYRELLAELIH